MMTFEKFFEVATAHPPGGSLIDAIRILTADSLSFANAAKPFPR
jgi:hypothetical protein